MQSVHLKPSLVARRKKMEKLKRPPEKKKTVFSRVWKEISNCPHICQDISFQSKVKESSLSSSIAHQILVAIFHFRDM